MSGPLNIGVATCGPHADAVRRVASRFGAVAQVEVVDAGSGGGAVEAITPVLLGVAPHVVVADPNPVPYLTEHLRTTVFPFEIGLDPLVRRIDEALGRAESVAVVVPTGTVTPTTARLLRRLAAPVHLFPAEGPAHLRDVVARCRRMGIGAVVGSESAVAIAREEGFPAISVNDRPDEPDGLISQMLLKAAAQAAPHVLGRTAKLVAYGLILEKICQGAIGPHDTALCVDGRGLVTAVFAHRCLGPAPGEDTLPLLTGVPLTEALDGPAARFTGHAEGGDLPLQLDLYPLAAAGAGGTVVVLRGEPRSAGPGAAVRPAWPESGRLEALLQRLEAVTERTEAVVQGRRRTAPRRFLASLRRRTFLLDWSRVRFFELRSGLVFAALATGETYATNYTLADIVARVDARAFFRIHRNVIVNLNYVTELERYGVSQLRVLIEGPEAPSFVVSRPASAALRKLLKY